MNDERRVKALKLVERGQKLALRDVRKLLHARINQEALEANDAAFAERRKRAEIAGDESAPEGNVHAATTARRVQFLAQAFERIALRAVARNDHDVRLTEGSPGRRRDTAVSFVPIRRRGPSGSGVWSW